MKDNLHNPADAKETKVFNSIVTYWQSQHEPTRDEREAQFAARQAMIEQTNKEIQNER